MNRRSLLAAALALASPLGAQIPVHGWIGDDGFQAACCTPIQAVNLPHFPAFQLDGRYACIKECDLEADYRVTVFTQHIPVSCDMAIMLLDVVPAEPDAPGWTGIMFARYSRTWVESDPNGGDQVQVWRWLVNMDATALAGSPPCPLPPHPAGLNAHFTGHIDYACVLDPTGGTLVFRAAVNMNHLPGCISHSVFGAAPLPGPPSPIAHHDRSYHLVAPDTFVFSPVPPPVGSTPGEALRNGLLPPLPYTCLAEAVVTDGRIDPIGQNCLCPGLPRTGPYAWFHQILTGSVRCRPGTPPSPYGSVWIQSPAPPIPTGFVSLPLGSWAGTDSFPGNRSLAVHFGVLYYVDPCTPRQIPFRIVTGLSTTGPPGVTFGEAADPLLGPPYTTFLDLQDMIIPVGIGGPFTLGFGTLFLSRIIWNINLL